MGLHEKIRELRLNNNISQKKLADAIGVAQSSINYWEKGQRTPSVDAAQRLADYFNITLDELYDINDISVVSNKSKYIDLFAGSASLANDYAREQQLKQLSVNINKNIKNQTTNTSDYLDINKILSSAEQLLSQDGLMFDGEPASPEAVESILSAMKIGMEMAKKKNKEKYTPKKYRKGNE